MTSPPKPSRHRWLIAVSAVLLFFIVSIVLGIRYLGRWLVVSDPLEPARAIVVLTGSTPYRAEEAAKIYRQKLAPEVWLTPGQPLAEMDRLGIHYDGEETYNIEVLKKLGVPAEAIRVLPQPTRNTEEEELGMLRELRQVGGDRVILVTSEYHTRRVKIIWHHLVGESPRAIVRGAPEEPFDASHWWRNSDDAKAVGHEFFGVLNAWAGFPVGPDRP